jgi:hypothetical protein
VHVTTATVDVAQFEPMMAAAVKAAETLNHGRARAGSAPETVGLLLADAGYWGVSDGLCKGVTSNLNRGCGFEERTRNGAGVGHWRGGTVSPGC